MPEPEEGFSVDPWPTRLEAIELGIGQPDGRFCWRHFSWLCWTREGECQAEWLQATHNADSEADEITRAHRFQGRLDRDCEICGNPDRAPIHTVPQKAGSAP